MTTYMGNGFHMAATDDVFGGDYSCVVCFPKDVLGGI